MGGLWRIMSGSGGDCCKLVETLRSFITQETNTLTEELLQFLDHETIETKEINS